MQIMTRLRPLAAGGYRDREEEDNQRGYERDETDTDFHQLVRHLATDGDDRASTAGRRARRTLAEMVPGYEQQPILRMTRALPLRAATEACGVCSRWNCNCPPWDGKASVRAYAGLSAGR